MARRVVVTGLGIVSCLGHELGEVARRLQKGSSGVRAMPEWDGKGLKSLVAGTLPDFEAKLEAAKLPKKLAPGMSDGARFAAVAALDAVGSSGLPDRLVRDPATACIVGSGIGSVDAIYRAGELYAAGRIRRSDPYAVLRGMSSTASSGVANLLGIRGRSYSLASACATSAHAIGHAWELVRSGRAERAIAGGGEDLAERIAAGFQGLRLALSTRYNDRPEAASRPFDRGRDGFVLSGGAGIVVLETLEAARSRGAPIRAEVAGFGATSDGHDLVLPEPSGERAAAAIEGALADAGADPSEVDYVNCHATGTLQGDPAEVAALRRVFGDRVPPFSSTKSMTGHGVGAAGALELLFTIAMIEEGFLAPSINVEEPDPSVAGLDLVTETREARPRLVVSNNFGFGGSNAALALRRFDG